VKLVGGWVEQPGADVVPESEVRSGRLGLAQARVLLAPPVLLGGVAQLVVVEACPGEECLFAGGLVVAGLKRFAG
jgi:hypothetical protein